MEYRKFAACCSYLHRRNVSRFSNRRRTSLDTGIVLNYINIVLKGGIPSSRPLLLWTGIIIIIFAILLSGKAYNNLAREKKKASLKGILLSVIAGLFIAFFYPVVVNSLDWAFVSGG